MPRKITFKINQLNIFHFTMSNQLLKTSKNSPERAINRPKQDLIFLRKHQKNSGLIAPAE